MSRDDGRCDDRFAIYTWGHVRELRCDRPYGHSGGHTHRYFRPGPLRRLARRLIRAS